MKKLSSSITSIDFVLINGRVQTIDTELHSVIESSFVPNCFGVIQRLITHEHKIKKIQEVWRTKKDTISYFTRSVPFQLRSARGNFVRIDDPLKFHLIQEELQVTTVKFNPTTQSAGQTLAQTLTGQVQTGIESEESMLFVNVPLNGIGRLEKRANIWHLIPHAKWEGILTRLSRNDIVSRYQSYANIFKFFCICFGVGAICTAAYLVYQYYDRRLPQRNDIRPSAPMEPPRENTQNARVQCVICQENEISFSVQPCSHLVFCETCAQDFQRNNQIEKICPLCRVPIQNYQRIFLP